MDFLQFREPVNAWTHGLWMLLAVPAGLWLAWRSRRSPLKLVSGAVFSVCLVLCAAGSSLYHAVKLSPEQIAVCAKLDYIGIFLLIAGTFTPVVAVVLRGAWRWSTMAMIWALAAAGITLRLFAVPLPDEVSTAFYILMGWTALVPCVQLVRTVSARAVRWLWVGGVLYSLGAVFNEVNWPNFAPGVFGAHELHHVTCMLASVCHFAFMMRVVVPFDQDLPPPRRRPAPRLGLQQV
jgi:hemolysin III